MKEDVFWRNYFYRVSLIKQSAQLTALAAHQQAAEKREEEKNAAPALNENISGVHTLTAGRVVILLIQ